MKSQLVLVVVRQAGSASGIMPAIEDLLSCSNNVKCVVIAFDLAFQACNEVLSNIQSNIKLYLVKDEKEAKAVFGKYLPKSSLVLTGTSGEASLDAYYWQLARNFNVETIGYIDQCSNIEARFGGGSIEFWPDSVVVTDAELKSLVTNISPLDVQVHVTSNPALLRIRRGVESLRLAGVVVDPNRILFATEPVENKEDFINRNGFNDESSFVLMMEIFKTFYRHATLVVRLHPRDSRDRWIEKIPKNVSFEWDSDSRVMSLARAGRVFGMTSMFLLEALVASVPVFSLQPQKKTKCLLTDGKMPVIVNFADYQHEHFKP